MGCGASKKDVVESGGAKSPPPEKKPAPAAEVKPTTPPPQAEASKPVVPDDKHNHQDVPAGEAPSNPPPPAQPQEAPKPAESHPPAAQPAPSSPSQQPKNEKEHRDGKEHKEPKEEHSQPAASAALPPAGPSDHKKPAEEKEKEKEKKDKDKEKEKDKDKEKEHHKEKDNKEKDHHEEKDKDDKDKEKSKTDFHLPALTPKKGTLLEIDLGSVPPSPSGKTAVQERLERYAEDRKGVGALRPSSASLERRMAEADSRRKQQAEQKVKKAKYTNELAKDKYSELREAEEKKTQELLQLIKNKNAQAATKRNQMQQEVKAKAEEEVSKARELSAKRKEGGSAPQTPHSNASDSAPVSARSEEDEKSLNKEKSILEVPLPPLK